MLTAHDNAATQNRTQALGNWGAVSNSKARGVPRRKALMLLIFLCAALLASDSFQFLLIMQSSEWRDLFANGIGVFLGVSAAGLVRLGFGLSQR